MTSSDDYYQKGNEAFVREEYESAINLYTEAIGMDSTQTNYYVNRANSNLKLEKYEEAKYDANKALELGTKEPRLRLWKGVACFHLGEYKDAENAFLEGKTLSESKDTFGVWLDRCAVKLQEIAVRESKIVRPIATPSLIIATPSLIIATPSLIKVRHEWYQTEINVIVTILVKNAKPGEVSVQIGSQSLRCSVEGNDKRVAYELDVNLAHTVNPAHSKWNVRQTKIEIQMEKLEGGLWKTLEEAQVIAKTASVSSKKNWDKVVTDITENDEKESEAGGDDLMGQLFGQCSDEMRRAMNKSFVESGGTVLSNNWEDVRKRKVKRETPTGMQWTQWDGKFVDQSEL